MDGQELLERLSGRARELLDACGLIAEERHERAYLVGGSVRDLILGRGETDLDVVVEGEGMAVAQALARAKGGRLTRHHVFQTARVDTRDGMRVDVATARSETYPQPGHLPRVVAGSLLEDLQRRDFTINAMAIALDPESHGELIDPEGGVADLRDEMIRVLHNRSFADDPTRILRALRFVDRFGYRLEERTGQQLADAVAGGYLGHVSGARIRRELAYVFSEAPVTGPLTLQEEGVLAAIGAGLAAEPTCLEDLARNRAWYADVLAEYGRTHAAEKGDGGDGKAGHHGNNGIDPEWTLVLTACAAGLKGQERWELATHLGLSRSERAPLVECGAPWRRAHQAWSELDAEGRRDPLRVDALFSHLAVGTLLVQLSSLETIDDENLRLALRHLLGRTQWVAPLSKGTDLIELGIPEGPEVGRVLEILRRARVAGTVADEEGERRMVLDWLDDSEGIVP